MRSAPTSDAPSPRPTVTNERVIATILPHPVCSSSKARPDSRSGCRGSVAIRVAGTVGARRPESRRIGRERTRPSAPLLGHSPQFAPRLGGTGCEVGSPPPADVPSHPVGRADVGAPSRSRPSSALSRPSLTPFGRARAMTWWSRRVLGVRIAEGTPGSYVAGSTGWRMIVFNRSGAVRFGSLM